MLLFVCHEPNPNTEKDGMVQRVRWIDAQFSDVRRIILHVWLKGGWRSGRYIRDQHLTVEKANLFLHLLRIVKLALRGDAIYVHSCYNALRAFPVYFSNVPVITDMHGVVPEESSLEGHPIFARLLSFVEGVVVRRSVGLVFVTHAMQEHFARKYGQRPKYGCYVIPILPEPLPQKQCTRDPQLVIYAGGVQPWQNVDLMVDTVRSTGDRFRYIFLTGQREMLAQKFHARGLPNVQIESVPKSQVFDYYRRASFGFVLRTDSIINRVACPTKLVEYLESGVVPIVESPHIGDFESAGYRYILREEFIRGIIPDVQTLQAMRNDNRAVIEALRVGGATELARLRKDLARVRSPDRA